MYLMFYPQGQKNSSIAGQKNLTQSVAENIEHGKIIIDFVLEVDDVDNINPTHSSTSCLP